MIEASRKLQRFAMPLGALSQVSALCILFLGEWFTLPLFFFFFFFFFASGFVSDECLEPDSFFLPILFFVSPFI